MATYVIGLLILVLLFLAGRHVVNNFRTGGHDCCGCTGCGSSGSVRAESRMGQGSIFTVTLPIVVNP